MTAELKGDFFDGEVCELYVGPNIIEAFWERRTGASRRVLERRVQYGGRKGRSAARRLAYGEATWNALRKYANRRYGLSVA